MLYRDRQSITLQRFCQAFIAAGACLFLPAHTMAQTARIVAHDENGYLASDATEPPSNFHLEHTGLPSIFNPYYSTLKLFYNRSGGTPNQTDTVSIWIVPDQTSGGHVHNAQTARAHSWLLTEEQYAKIGKYVVMGPKGVPGTLDYSSETAQPFQITVPLDEFGDGSTPFYLVCGETCGNEVLWAQDETEPTNLATFSLEIQYNGLQPLAASNTITLVNNPPYNTAHPDSNYGTPALISALQALASNWYDATAQPLGVNDMSLPLGGLFDIGPPFTSGGTAAQYWFYPHVGHRLGLEADVKVVPLNSTFDKILSDQGWWHINSAFEKSEGNHYHIGLEGTPGKVVIRPGQHAWDLPTATWKDKKNRILVVSFYVQNYGGVNADSVSIVSVTGSAGVTVDSSTTFPIAVGALAVRDGTNSSVSNGLVTLVVDVPKQTGHFALTITPSATANGTTQTSTPSTTALIKVP